MVQIRKSLREKAPESEVFGVEEALAKLSMQLVEPSGKKVFTISDITPEEVFYLAMLQSIAERIGSDSMKKWIQNFLLLRCSRLRIGRKELLLLGTGMRQASDVKKAGGLGSLFAGFK